MRLSDTVSILLGVVVILLSVLGLWAAVVGFMGVILSVEHAGPILFAGIGCLSIAGVLGFSIKAEF